ncbi:anaphase-promoting complex subunit 11 [Crepidotus variabilis]|uniref:Anaphase-promoting complex subunit 11 n=1 Tax=Crepidotus variabilis TaxID=179855 RepID=A0A9P6ECX4_9AGAR|nr:anaphase-promoting complex subunit 11 [Crepidotus variabilis]
MKVVVKRWNAVAHWKWDTRNTSDQQEETHASNNQEEDDEEDVCGICRVAYEACCPACKTPGDDCPLSAFLSLLGNKIL